MSTELESESTPAIQRQQRSSSLCFPCFVSPSRSVWWDRVRSTSLSDSHAATTSSADRWWSRGLKAFKKLREWSEIVAGPRWKTFIRRFNHHRSPKRMAKYQYDPLSYALNFDEGMGQNPDEGFRNFSTRYSAVTVSPEPCADVAVLV